MGYWHWRPCRDRKGLMVVSRAHGRELVSRWDGEGLPPVHSVGRQSGAPALEQTHPFHFKMCPGVMLGPRCNHDLGVLLRLPVPKHLMTEFSESPTRGFDVLQAKLTLDAVPYAGQPAGGLVDMNCPHGAKLGDAHGLLPLRPRGSAAGGLAGMEDQHGADQGDAYGSCPARPCGSSSWVSDSNALPDLGDAHGLLPLRPRGSAAGSWPVWRISMEPTRGTRMDFFLRAPAVPAAGCLTAMQCLNR